MIDYTGAGAVRYHYGSSQAKLLYYQLPNKVNLHSKYISQTHIETFDVVSTVKCER